MPFEDFREFIAKLEAEGELQHIEEEVDWDLEAGAMLRRSYEQKLPVPLFEKIKGYPKGYRLCGGGVANYRQIAISLGMEPDTHPKQIVEEYLNRKQKRVKPVVVKSGPCKENIRIGKDVDLFELPVPMVHDGDGGRFIGTWHLSISRDLETDWVNWGMYRHMVHDKNSAGILLVSPAQHLHCMYHQSYEPRKKTMDVAIVIGVDPVLTLCAVSPLPYGVSEVEVAGALRGKPVKLVKCETIDLMVPATAEIVIEGEMRPGERKDEGPFGEYTGYMAGTRSPRPVIHVKAITYRNDPILTFCSQGTPVSDGGIVEIAAAAEILESLRARGLPVTAVSIPPEAVTTLTVVAVKNAYFGIADDVAHACWASKKANSMPYLVIVEDDVDPFDMTQVVHALVTKCHPYRGIVRTERTHSSSLLPFLSREEKKFGLGAKAYFDCTWPFDWDPADIPKRASFDCLYPPEIQKKALAKWRKYGH